MIELQLIKYKNGDGKMNDNLKFLLTELLNCGTSDLSLLEDVGLDWVDVIQETKNNGDIIELSSLFNSIIRIGLNNLHYQIQERIEKLEGYELSQDEITELESLKKLNVENDFSTFFNYLDTHFYLIKNKDIYLEYLEEEISKLHDDTSFDLSY